MAKKATDSTEEEELETDVDEEVDPADDAEDETDDEQEDDSDDEGDEETDDESEEDDDGEEEDDESDEDEEDSEFTKRFTQFKGDSPSEYLKNLEEGYAESSKEAVRLSRETKALKESVDNINRAIATNPELAKMLEGATKDAAETPVAPKDPAILFAESQMREVWTKEYNEFAANHPEVETDAKLAEEMDSQLAILKDVVWAREKRQLGMKEGLEMAWKILGKDTNDKQEKVRMAAKASASQGKSSGGKKSKEAKPKLSNSQIQVAMDMFGVDRPTAIKQLSEYV